MADKELERLIEGLERDPDNPDLMRRLGTLVQRDKNADSETILKLISFYQSSAGTYQASKDADIASALALKHILAEVSNVEGKKCGLVAAYKDCKRLHARFKSPDEIFELSVKDFKEQYPFLTEGDQEGLLEHLQTYRRIASDVLDGKLKITVVGVDTEFTNCVMELGLSIEGIQDMVYTHPTWYDRRGTHTPLNIYDSGGDPSTPNDKAVLVPYNNETDCVITAEDYLLDNTGLDIYLTLEDGSFYIQTDDNDLEINLEKIRKVKDLIVNQIVPRHANRLLYDIRFNLSCMGSEYDSHQIKQKILLAEKERTAKFNQILGAEI